MTADYTLGKNEHLCKQKLIDLLFSGSAETFMAWPVRMVCLLVDKKCEQDASVQLLVSVSKRYFKHAVDRNRVKRQLRECFRLNRHDLMAWLEQHPQKQLLVAYVWQDGKLHETVDVRKAMLKAMKLLVDRLTPDGQLIGKSKTVKS